MDEKTCPCGKPLTALQIRRGNSHCSVSCGMLYRAKGKPPDPQPGRGIKRVHPEAQWAWRRCMGKRGDGEFCNTLFWSEGPWRRICPECSERIALLSQRDRCEPQGLLNMGHLGAQAE